MTWTLRGIVVVLVGFVAGLSAAARQTELTASDIPALIVQLASPESEWGAAARLQKLGTPAAAALVGNLRRDGFRDRDHGNHSATMRALEKIGTPAVVEIERTLSPALLASTTADDVRFVETVTLSLITIGSDRSAPVLVRVGLSASESRTREFAFTGLTSPFFDRAPTRPDRPWEACLLAEVAFGCPFDLEAPRVAAAIRPLLGSVASGLAQESNPRVKVLAARLLALWGEGPLKTTGERELLALAALSDGSYPQELAIQALGVLGVGEARDVLKRTTAIAYPSVKRAAAEALARLQDDGYVSIATDLMKLPTANLRTYDPDVYTRRWAILFAGRSRNLAFVPTLIDLLGNADWNGNTTSTTSGGRTTEIRHTLGEDAHAALRTLTFQDFASNPHLWREWWSANQNNDWRSVLTRRVQTLMPQLPTAEPWVMNEWMSGFAEADDPAVLPFVTAYFRHPRFNIGQVGPNSFRGGGGIPPALTLLLNLASQGSPEARQLLFECSDKNDYPLAIDCPRLVAAFDRQRGVDRLNSLLTQPYSLHVARTLVELGDSRGIPVLIELLESPENAARSLSYQALRRYTQQDIAYNADASPDSRRAAADQWRQWWRNSGSGFVLKTKAARIDIDCCRL